MAGDIPESIKKTVPGCSTDSIPSSGPVQVVNVYSGKVSEGEQVGIPDWLKDKFEEFKKFLMEAGGHGGRSGRFSLQSLLSNALLVLILLVVLGQAAYVIYKPPPEQPKDDSADRQLLMSMLTMMAARSQTPVVVPPPAQCDASPKVVVVPVSTPSASASTGTPAKVQLEPLQIEVKTTSDLKGGGVSDTAQLAPQKQGESKLPQLAPENPVRITAWFASENKCKKIQDDNRPFIYFAFSNVGSSTVLIDSIEGPMFSPSLGSKGLAGFFASDSPAVSTGKETQVIYPGETRNQAVTCVDIRSGGTTISKNAPAVVVLGISYHLVSAGTPVQFERAAFFLAPLTAPTVIAASSGVRAP